MASEEWGGNSDMTYLNGHQQRRVDRARQMMTLSREPDGAAKITALVRKGESLGRPDLDGAFANGVLGMQIEFLLEVIGELTTGGTGGQ
jgi:hypothetical protein